MQKLHIIIPYYSNRESLRLSIKSVLAQTSPNWFLTIIDDAGPEDDSAWVNSLRDKRVDYSRNTRNIGISHNFQKSLCTAKTDYCTILGADDIIKPEYVSRFIEIEKDNDFDIYQPNVEIIDDNNKVYLPLGDKVKKFLRGSKQGILQGEKLAKSLMIGNWLYFPSIVWKTSTARKYGFSSKYEIVEDFKLEQEIILGDGKVFVDDVTTFQYCRSSKSASGIAHIDGKMHKEEDALFTELAEQFAEKGWKSAKRMAKLHLTSRINRILKK